MFAKSITAALVATLGLTAQSVFAQEATELQLAGVKANFERTFPIRDLTLPMADSSSSSRGSTCPPVPAHLQPFGSPQCFLLVKRQCRARNPACGQCRLERADLDRRRCIQLLRFIRQ